MDDATNSQNLAQVIRERDLLAEAIASAAKKAGLYNGTAPLTGPHLLMLAEDLGEFLVDMEPRLVAATGAGGPLAVKDPVWVEGSVAGRTVKVIEGSEEPYVVGVQEDGTAYARSESGRRTHPDEQSAMSDLETEFRAAVTRKILECLAPTATGPVDPFRVRECTGSLRRVAENLRREGDGDSWICIVEMADEIDRYAGSVLAESVTAVAAAAEIEGMLSDGERPEWGQVSPLIDRLVALASSASTGDGPELEVDEGCVVYRHGPVSVTVASEFATVHNAEKDIAAKRVALDGGFWKAAAPYWTGD